MALPLIALPILIHLINRNRHQSVSWAAMMFLVNANRMNKGMARLRYFVILMLRMAAVAAIVFAASRPMVSGPMSGLGFSKPDATVILLDRSASMAEMDLQTGESKRSTALTKLGELLGKRDYGSQLILIDSASGDVQQLGAPNDLLDLPITRTNATSANIATMLERALAYLKANEAGRADVWILSDLRSNDWHPDSGRWSAIREQFAPMQGVQLFLLSYADRANGNLSIRVDNVARQQRGNQSELVLDVLVQADRSTSDAVRQVPVEFEINNVRSVVNVTLDGQNGSLLGHRIAIDDTLRSGWGTVALPGDSNALDNTFYFVFSAPATRHAVIVTDDTSMAEAFRLGLAIPMAVDLKHDVKVIPIARAGDIDWEDLSLLIWQAPLPTGTVAEQIEQFIDAGRTAMFFPSQERDDGETFGLRWGQWSEPVEGDQRKLTWWRSDADLLGNVASGDPLPLQELRTYRHRAIESAAAGTPGTTLATLGSNTPLITRAVTDRGAVYFSGALPTARFSSLQRDAVAFYVMLQRAMTLGSLSLAAAGQRDAGADVKKALASAELIAPETDAPTLSERGLHGGIFRDGEIWTAVNRSQAEDNANVVPVAAIDDLFSGLPYQRIDDAVGDTESLTNELWRAFLLLMALALIVEAILCLPEKRETKAGVSDFGTSASSAYRAAA